MHAPAPQDILQAYQSAMAARRLLYARCRDCRTAQLPLASVCRACGATALALEEAAGSATVHSFTIVHRAPADAWRDQVPYALVLLDMSEGYRMMVNLSGDVAALRIGDPVRIGWTVSPDGSTRPCAMREAEPEVGADHARHRHRPSVPT